MNMWSPRGVSSRYLSVTLYLAGGISDLQSWLHWANGSKIEPEKDGALLIGRFVLFSTRKIFEQP